MRKRQLAAVVRTDSPELVAELYRQRNDPKDRKGRTLLHYAAAVRRGAAEIIAALAAVGADLDAGDRNGLTALHHAARNENYAAFAALVGSGANPSLKDRRGRTPLQMLNRPGRYPHDAIARFTFGHPVMARGLLRTILPAGMVPDDADIRRIDGELVSHALSRTLRSDMILVLERKDAGPIAVIVEFQSGVDREMAERMASYRIELARTIRRNYGDLVDARGRVPFTVPVVVHTGSDAWDAVDDAESLTAPPNHPDLEIYRSPARYAVHDVQREDYSAYENNPAAAYFRLHRGDRAETLGAFEELERLLPLDKYRSLRHLLLTMTALGSEWFPEAALEGSPLMTGFAQHYDATVERANAADARANAADARANAADARANAADARIEAADARAEAAMAVQRELMADLAAERFGAETGERLKSVLDGIVDLKDLLDAKARVKASRSAEELFSYFERRH